MIAFTGQKGFDIIDLHHAIIILQEIMEDCVGWWLPGWWSSSHRQFEPEATTVTGPLAILPGFQCA